MKILHCITDLSPDGAQRTLLRLLRDLPQPTIESHVVTLMAGGTLAPSFHEIGVPTYALGMKRGIPSFRALIRYRELLLQIKPDVVQGWMYHGNIASTLAVPLARKKIPVLWNVRRSLHDPSGDKRLTRYMAKFSRFLSRWPDKIVYCIGESADQHERFGFDRSKRIVIPNGFDSVRFAPFLGTRRSKRVAFGLPQTNQLVGIVGRYNAAKDYPTFLRAALLVFKELPETRFVMVGRDVDPGNSELLRMLDEMHLREKVILLGERQDVHEIMPLFDIFCSSSANEGFANVLGEAMACGVPCVATDAGASREIVEGIGIVVDRGNPAALAAGLCTLLRETPEERKARGVASRKRIVERYSLDGMVSAYLELYRSMVPAAVRGTIGRTESITTGRAA